MDYSQGMIAKCNIVLSKLTQEKSRKKLPVKKP